MKAEPAQPQRPRPQRSTSSFTSFIRKLTGRSASPPQKKDISSSRGRDDPNPQAVSLLAPALLPNARASPVPQNGASNMPNLQRAAHPQEPMIPFVPVRPVLSPINTATKPIDQLSPPPRPPRRLSSNDSSTSRSKVLLGPSIPGSAVLVETGSTPVIGMVAPALEVEGMKHGEVEPWMVPLPASPMVGVLDIEEEVSDPREALRTSGKEISQSEGGVPTSQEDRSPLSPVPVSTGEPSFAEKDDEEEESDTFQPLHTPSEPAPPLTIRIPQNSTHQHEGPSPLSNTSVSPVSAFSPYTPVSEGERDMRFAGSSPPRKAPIGTGKVSGLGRKDSRWKTSVMSLSDVSTFLPYFLPSFILLVLSFSLASFQTSFLPFSCAPCLLASLPHSSQILSLLAHRSWGEKR